MKQFDNSLENIGRPGSFVGYGIGWAAASAGPLDYFKLTVGRGRDSNSPDHCRSRCKSRTAG